MNNKANLLGLALKAKKVVIGSAGFKQLATNDAHLLIINESIAQNNHKKLLNRAKFYNKNVIYFSKTVFDTVFTNKNVMYCIIIDKGFSKRLSSM